MLIGHSQLVKDFKNLVKNNRLAHGYIFFGEPEVGKFYFAKHLANLLESKELGLSIRPLSDALILDDATGIDAMRDLKSFLWQKPVISSKRLVVINNAENLTPQAQNAILKITEEPPEHSLIILIVNQLDNLLSPLLSRMQKIYFGRLSDSEMEELLKTQNLKLETQTINLSFGRPGRLMRLLEDSQNKEVEKYADNFLRMNGKAKSDLIKELVEEQKERPELLDRFFESLILKLRQDPIKNLDTLRSVMHRLFLIKSYNTNKRLQLEAIQ